MPVFRGSTTGSILSQQYLQPAHIKSISLVNRSGGTCTASVAIVENGTQVYIRTIVLNNTTDVQYTDDIEILLLAGFEVLIIASAALDYYITIE